MAILKVDVEDQVAVFEFAGELVKGELADLTVRLQEAINQGARGVLFDLKQVDFLDSSGVGLLLEAKKYVEKNSEVPIALCEVPPGIYKVLDRLGVENVFRILKGRGSAIKKLL